MLWEPGAIAHPTKLMTQTTTRNDFLAWNVSEAKARIGPTTACTNDMEFGTHVWISVPLRSVPMYESCVPIISVCLRV